MAVRIPCEKRPRLRYDGETDAIVCGMRLNLGFDMTRWRVFMKYNDCEVLRCTQSFGSIMSQDRKAGSSNGPQRTGRLSAPGGTRLSPLPMGNRRDCAFWFYGPFGTYHKKPQSRRMRRRCSVGQVARPSQRHTHNEPPHLLNARGW